MPEFEEHERQTNPQHSYAPSQDAKPRSRRRSGGFKKESEPLTPGGIGEVDPVDALGKEKLSGTPESKDPEPKRERKPDPKPAEAEAPAPRKSEPRDSKPSDKAQPGEATLAAIQKVEASLHERKAGRDARRKDRDAKRPSGDRKSGPQGKSADRSKPTTKPEGGLISAITGFFGNLFGSAPEPPKPQDKPRGKPQGSDTRRPRGNRGGSGTGRGGPNRKRGGRSGPNNRRGGNHNRRRQPQGSRND